MALRISFSYVLLRLDVRELFDALCEAAGEGLLRVEVIEQAPL